MYSSWLDNRRGVVSSNHRSVEQIYCWPVDVFSTDEERTGDQGRQGDYVFDKDADGHPVPVLLWCGARVSPCTGRKLRRRHSNQCHLSSRIFVGELGWSQIYGWRQNGSSAHPHRPGDGHIYGTTLEIHITMPLPTHAELIGDGAWEEQWALAGAQHNKAIGYNQDSRAFDQKINIIFFVLLSASGSYQDSFEISY